MNKSMGQVMTPKTLASRAVALKQNNGRVLEPSSGTGVFLDLLPSAQGIELDQTLVKSEHAHRVTVADFFSVIPDERFETIIGNPPYVCAKNNSRGKTVTHRVKQELSSATLPPAANLYLRFIERCFRELLTKHGELIFIVPLEFFHVTSAAKLREEMLKHGSFTDVWFQIHDEWEASVEVCVFRYQKGIVGLRPRRDGVLCHEVTKDGCTFFMAQRPIAFLGDFFDTTVGARPRKTNVHTVPAPGLIEFGSNKGSRWCSLNEPWPRSKRPMPGAKILFEEGPTRKGPYFVPSDCDRFLSCAMLPKRPGLDLQKWADFLENYDGWEELNIRVSGRWRVGPRLIGAVPLTRLPE